MKNVAEFTPNSVVAVEAGGVVAHDVECTEHDVTQDTIQRWGQSGFWPAGCCIEVDVEPVEAGMESVKTHLGGNVAQKTAPVDPMEDGDDMTEAQVIELIESLGRKFEMADMTKPLIRFATSWAQSWTGTFSFMVDMKEAAGSRRGLSVGQASGTLNCFRADHNRKAPVERGSGDQELDLSELPKGTYAVPGGETRLKVTISKPGARSKWEGWTFVSDGAEYGSQKRYGKQAPGSIYVGEIQDELAKILADPQEAAAEYGRITGTCGLCNRPLEDEDSVARGIGPVCLKKFGG